ncbi:G-protein coupled receptor 55-like [Ambystoma mexicanum]|uniref:G-protein coupled receptor 55-like n=1 Tax=Ambystoma mexicanum TaxID=8296 RepID=UPI0037E921B8
MLVLSKEQCEGLERKHRQEPGTRSGRKEGEEKPSTQTRKMSDNSILLSVDVFQMVVYIPTFIVGLLFNAMALWMVFFKIRKWMESTTYVVCLITLDTVLLFTLPFKVAAYNKGIQWDLGSKFCSFLETLYFVNMYGSILISVCICVDRYIAIRYPFTSRSLRSPKKATVVCAVVFLVVWTASSGSVYKLHEAKGNETQCFYGFSNATWTKVSLITMLETVFVSSALIMIFCTVTIILALRKKLESRNTAIKSSRSMKVVVANLMTYLVCFTPFHLSLLLYYFVKNNILDSSHHDPIRIFVQVSLCLANLNCCLDGICYYLVFKEFGKSASDETAGVHLDIPENAN